MKLLDTINEGLSHQNEESDDLTDEQRKELKSAKTIFKALKNGEVKFNKNFDQKIIKYKLKDPYFLWEYKAGTKKFSCEINNIDIYITDPKLYEEIKDYVHRAEGEMLPMSGVIMERHINPQIRKRFGNFNIDMSLYHANNNFILVEPQPINEDESIDREKKRAKTVYNALKKGIFTLEDGTKYRYVLSDEYQLSIGPSTTLLFIIPYGDTTNWMTNLNSYKFMVFKMKPNGEEFLGREKEDNIQIYNMLFKKIYNKFENFNINLR